jgi:hypothetical protein
VACQPQLAQQTAEAAAQQQQLFQNCNICTLCRNTSSKLGCLCTVRCTVH